MKMNRQQKKDAWAVVKKYTSQERLKEDRRFRIGMHTGGASLIGLGVGLDLLLTGGLFSGLGLALAGTGVYVSSITEAFYASERTKHTHQNVAGQTVKGRGIVLDVLDTIKWQLHDKFENAMDARGSGTAEVLKTIFLQFSEEAQTDIQKLSPFFKIVADNGKKGYALEFPMDGKTVTIQEAIDTINQPFVPPPLQLTTEEKIEALEKQVAEQKAQIEKMQEPRVIKLNKPKLYPKS